MVGTQTMTTLALTSIVMTPAASARLVHPSYIGHMPSWGLALAFPITTTCIDLMEVPPEVWTGPAGHCTEFRDRDLEAVWDGYLGDGECLGQTACDGLWAKFGGVGAVGRAPISTMFDGCYWCHSQDQLSGALSASGTGLPRWLWC